MRFEPFMDPFPEHVPSEYWVRAAQDGWEHRQVAALRRAVFCDEQGLFGGAGCDDRDAVDAAAQPLAALACVAGQPDQVVGTVRIHEACRVDGGAEPGVWWGSRLAVHRDFRGVSHLGAALIRLAVGTAHGHGCHTFLAHVQAQNVPLFERLNWRLLKTLTLHGRPHGLMQADLAHYPPVADAAQGFVLSLARLQVARGAQAARGSALRRVA